MIEKSLLLTYVSASGFSISVMIQHEVLELYNSEKQKAANVTRNRSFLLPQ